MATIGIDATALSTPASGGIGTSQYRTLRALAELDTEHRFILYAAKPPVVPFSDEPLDLPFELRLGTGATTRSNIVWMQTGINRMLAEDGVEVFWGPRHLLPFRAKGVGTVATVHDVWDRYYPKQQPWRNRMANATIIDRILRTADEVVTPSAATADDLTRFFGADRASIHVVPWGVDHSVFAPAPAEQVAAVLGRHGIERPYLLSLDMYNPRKNFSAVLRAVAHMPHHEREHFEIVGVGRPRRTASEIDPFAKAVALGLRGHVRFLDDVSAQDLVALYSGAMAFVYPSVYEGFGMPVLEAMSCGAPVITSDRSSLPEVAGDAALLADPESTEALSHAIASIASDTELAGSLREAGLARAEQFTWRRTAEGMLASFERALESRRGAALSPDDSGIEF